MEQRILQLLLKPSAYPEPTISIHLVQTHVSFIFITDKFVYKIKKPVDFGFLNFTTLDRRRFYCNEEVRLNRRLCPDIYLGVVEVRESADSASFDGEGNVIDYAVKMKKLPHERMLDRLLQRQEVTDGDIRRVARTIAQFHLNAERSELIDGFGSMESIGRNWEENFQQVAGLAPLTIAKRDLQLIRDWMERFLTDNRALFAERVSGGFIRDCDGDIHAGNICLTDDVCIFDCIEFNNRFRYSDTAADIAFLLMDFDLHGRPDFSDVFLSEYIAVTGDSQIDRLLEFYKAYRAVVRGKVESFLLHDADATDGEKEEAGERAVNYFQLARGYVIRRRLPPSMIITCGLMGSGKSTVTRSLAIQLGLCTLSSDHVRKELAGVPVYSHAAAGYGTGIYGPEMNRATYDELLARAERVLCSGRSVVVDASFRARRDRDRFRALARRLSVPFYIILTSCPEEETRKRLFERPSRSHEASDGRWELSGKQKEEFEPLSPDESEQICIDTSLPLPDTIDIILCRLGLL